MAGVDHVTAEPIRVTSRVGTVGHDAGALAVPGRAGA